MTTQYKTHRRLSNPTEEYLAYNSEHRAFIFIWFLCLMVYQLFLGYLMPKPFS